MISDVPEAGQQPPRHEAQLIQQRDGAVHINITLSLQNMPWRN